jgi:Flp pilus assembly protein TadD
VAALLVGAVVGLVLLSNDNRGGDGGQRANGGSSTTQRVARKPARKEKVAAQKPQAQSKAKAPPPAAPAQTTDPATLNDRGHQLIQQGEYAAAVEPLRASVQAYRDAGRTDELGYYFALFNLGVALNRSGDPEGAVEVLRERLRNPNQRATVQQELAAAREKLAAERGSGRGNRQGSG